MRARIRVLDAPGCYERAARVERKSALYYTTRLRIGQSCRAVCTKKSGLNASGHSHAYAHCRTIGVKALRRCFERPAEQAPRWR